MTPDDHRADGRCAFADDDAAYVLGLLDEERHAEFATHLAGCAECTERVATLAPTVVALSRLTPGDLAGLDEPPEPALESLLPSLARAAARRRRRLRAAVVTSAALAAAAVVALFVVVFGTAGTGGPAPQPVAATRTMSAVTTTPLTATVALASEPWGTRISVTCDYARQGPYPPQPGAYLLQVTDVSGAQHRLGSWTQAGREVHFTGGTSLPMNEIRVVQVVQPDGSPVLALPVR